MTLQKKLLPIGLALSLTVPVAIAAEEDPVYGRAGNFIIKKSDFERMIGYYNPQLQQSIEAHPQQKVAVVKRILASKVVAEEARKEGFDKTPNVKEKLQYILDDLLAQEYLKNIALKGVNVTEEEMRKYYKENERKLAIPEQVKVRHVLIKVATGASEDQKKRAKEKAAELLKKIKDGEDFAKIVSEFSEDSGSKAKGGDLGYFSRGRMVKPFEDAAFSLKPGQVSDVIETQFGYHIIKVEDHKEARVRPFEEVRETVRARVEAQLGASKKEELVKKFAQEAGVEIYSETILGKGK